MMKKMAEQKGPTYFIHLSTTIEGEVLPPEDPHRSIVFDPPIIVRSGEAVLVTIGDGDVKVERQIDGEATRIAGELPAPEGDADE